jgi:hypothetical protein
MANTILIRFRSVRKWRIVPIESGAPYRIGLQQLHPSRFAGRREIFEPQRRQERKGFSVFAAAGRGLARLKKEILGVLCVLAVKLGCGGRLR